VISLVSKFILHLRQFLKTEGISFISFSVKVSNFHLSAISEFSSIFVCIFSIFSHIENTLYFQFFITMVSLSSSKVNSFATLFNAFISLDKNTQFCHIQTIIGLHSFAQTRVSGFSLSITAIAYAQTSFLVIFPIVVIIFQSN